MQSLLGRDVKIKEGTYQGAAGNVVGEDTDGNYQVFISGVFNGEVVETTETIAPISLELI